MVWHLIHVLVNLFWNAVRLSRMTPDEKAFEILVLRRQQRRGPRELLLVKYLLDTNTGTRYSNGTSQSVFEHLNTQNEGDVAVCAVVKAELFYGAMHSRNPSQNLANQQRLLARSPLMTPPPRIMGVFALNWHEPAHQLAAMI